MVSDGSNIDVLKQKYKELIDFSDSMQKSNFKFIDQYIRRQTRKQPTGWEQDCESFLYDVIDLQKKLLREQESYCERFHGT